jgi:hypothetical protein
VCSESKLVRDDVVASSAVRIKWIAGSQSGLMIGEFECPREGGLPWCSMERM